MDISLYEFESYKSYLIQRLGPQGTRSGLRSQMAASLRCQSAFVSQVLNKSAHFSLEQAERLNRFFGHTQEESHLFLLMVQRDRAGTSELATYFQDQITEVQKRRLEVKNRIDVRGRITPDQRARYYSSWVHAAVHIALTVSELNTKERISDYLGIPLSIVSASLDFLGQSNLITFKHGRYTTGNVEIHLDGKSVDIFKHHFNWRVRSIESLGRELKTDMHYSAVVSVSKNDAVRLKNIMLDQLRKNLQMIQVSQAEELFCLNLDFFGLGK